MKKILIILSICALTGCDKKPTPDYFSDRLVDVELAYAQHPENINKADEEDTTPLVNAIINNNLEIVTFLLSNNADPNYVPNPDTQIGPLGYATHSKINKTDIIKVLMENGADINGHTDNGITPIMHAMLPLDNHPNIENIKTLLSYEPDVNAVDSSGYPVLFWAMSHTNDISDIIGLLIEHGAKLNSKYHDGNTTILTQTIHNGEYHINNIKTIIDSGENVNLITNDKWSALMEAIVRKDKNVIQLLLDNGADANITTEYDNTGLMYLARDENDTSEIMELLLRYGAKIDQQNDIGQPALFFAAEHGNINNLKTLLKHGANAKITETDGNNVLMKTVFQNRPVEIIKLLLKHVDVNQTSNKGATALCAAVAVQRYDLVKLLIDNEANVNQYCGPINPLILATDANNPEIIKYLVEQGADVNAVENDDHHKWSTLLIATEKGNLDIVKYLVEHGANIEYDATGDNDMPGLKFMRVTALSHATRRNHIDIVKYLISKGASKDGMVWAAEMSYDLDTMRYVSEISTEKGTKELKQAVQTCDALLTNMVRLTIKNVPEDKQKNIAGTNFAEATYLYVYLTMVPESKRDSKYYGPKHTDFDYLNAYKHTLKELEYRNLLYAKSTDETLDDISEYFAEKTLFEEKHTYIGTLVTPIAFQCTILSRIINE